jgi:ferredoxin-NADP reductase
VSLFLPVAPSSVLAFLTMVHLALAAIRNHRQTGPGRGSALALVSLLLAGMPWLFPSAIGLAAGLAAHGVWFIVCERFAPVQAPRGGTSPAPVDAARAPVPPAGSRRPAATLRPKGFVQVPVLAAVDETPDVRTFRFARPEGFDFVAGQFLPVRVRIDGQDHIRCYSISSAPEARGYLEISVKRQGLVSNTLHATLRPGLLVTVKAPAGAFTYPAADDRPLVLIAGGIGITPVMSMWRHAVQCDPGRAITLLYSAQTADALAFRDEIALTARRHPQTRVIFAVTRGEVPSDVYPGRIDDSLIRTTVPNAAHAIALLCGPQAMIDGVRATLAALGVPPANIRSEVFELAVAAAAGHTPRAAAPTDVQAHEVRCSKSGAAVPVAPGQTLLEAAEAGGVSIDSICRSGVCGTCRTRVLGGDVDCDSTLLDDAERQDGYVLACVSHVHSDCTIDA